MTNKTKAINTATSYGGRKMILSRERRHVRTDMRAIDGESIEVNKRSKKRLREGKGGKERQTDRGRGTESEKTLHERNEERRP
mmetsp:Transcript_40185/g.79211  ORF Transcript_40185/g.79211 Transcript_40185/m.79211 type:complete len:83 (+) Transcript_40185:1851-2099(+)